MYRQLFALTAIVCFASSAQLAQPKGVWWDRDVPSTEVEEAEETARFNPFFYALPNQLAGYLRVTPPNTQETEFALDGAVPQEDEILQYEAKARQPLNRRRKPLRTTKKPKRKQPLRKPRPTKRPLIPPPVKQHPIPKDPPSKFEYMEDMKYPEIGGYGYPYFDAENYYPPPPPPPLPFWPPPFPAAAYYGYALPEQQFGQQPSTTQSQPPAPQPTSQPQLQLQIPTDQNTLHLLQLALLLQQTLATAAAVTAGSPNISATAIAGATAVPISGATAVATSAVTPPVRPSEAAISSAASVASPAAGASSLPSVVASSVTAVGSTSASVVQSPQIQQQFFTVATTVSPVVATAAQLPAAEANGDDIVIGDNKQANPLKSIATPDAIELTEPEKIAAAPSAESESVMNVEPAKIEENPMQLVDSPPLYVRTPIPAIKSPEQSTEDSSAESLSPSDALTTEKEIVATVPYYPRDDDATLADEYQMVEQRYVKPIGYRPDSPDNFQGRRRGKSRVLRR